MLTPAPSVADCEKGLIRDNHLDSIPQIITLNVKGMTCAACTCSIETTLKSNLHELKSVNVDLMLQTVTIEGKVKVSEAVKLIKQAGFTVSGSSNDWRGRLEARRRNDLQEFHDLKQRFLAILFFSVPVILAQHFFEPLAIVFSLPLHLYAALDIYKTAWRICCMERLIALNCAASLLYSVILRNQHSLFDCAAFVLLLFSGGKFLENVLKRKIQAGSSDDLLISLPKTVKSNGVFVSVKGLQEGHVIDLGPGDLIPFDGLIVNCEYCLFVNEATLTGEPLPKLKLANDHVLAGTTVVSGNACMKITRSHEDSFINKLARGVYEPMLDNEENDSFGYADEIARWFIPGVLVLSVGTFAMWYVMFKISSASPADLIPEWRDYRKYPSSPLAASLYFGLTVLCVACPCALALATPIAVAVVKSAALRKGILVRDAKALQKAKSIDVLLFDKTGTLTNGAPEITFTPIASQFSSWMLEACRALEGKLLESQEHPIARSIHQFCSRDAQKNDVYIEDIRMLLGEGVEGTIVKDNEAHVIRIVKSTERDSCRSSSSTLFVDFVKVGEFTWLDELKPETLDTINFFKLTQKFRLGIVSGDSQVAVERTAAKFIPGSFTYVFGDCKPADKSRIVDDLRQQGFRVAFCGDGLNDALAMARANFSISLDPCTTFPSITLFKCPSISQLPQIFYHARALNRQIAFNFTWTILYNLLVIPLAMGAGVFLGGIKPIGPEIGVALMMASMISILLTSFIQ